MLLVLDAAAQIGLRRAALSHAASAAARIRSAVGFWPASRRSASSTRTAQAPAADSATPAVRIVPSAFSDDLHRRRGGGEVADLALDLLVRAGRAIVRHRELRAERHLAFANRRREAVDEKIVDRDAARAALAAHDDLAREASATAVQSPAGSLWHRLPTTVPICRTTGSATTRDASWIGSIDARRSTARARSRCPARSRRRPARDRPPAGSSNRSAR